MASSYRLDASTAICRAAVGAATAYALKTNLYAGAAIGGLSVLIDKVSKCVFGRYIKPSNIVEKSDSIQAFSQGMVVSTAFFHGLQNKYVTPYFTVSFTLPQIFFIYQVSRTLGNIAGRFIHTIIASYFGDPSSKPLIPK